MKKNMGKTDRIVRIAIAIVILLLYLAGYLSGTLAIILGILAVIFLLTSLVSFCPLYTLFDFSTLRK
jgi:hypothetical protein